MERYFKRIANFTFIFHHICDKIGQENYIGRTKYGFNN